MTRWRIERVAALSHSIPDTTQPEPGMGTVTPRTARSGAGRERSDRHGSVVSRRRAAKRSGDVKRSPSPVRRPSPLSPPPSPHSSHRCISQLGRSGGGCVTIASRPSPATKRTIPPAGGPPRTTLPDARSGRLGLVHAKGRRQCWHVVQTLTCERHSAIA